MNKKVIVIDLDGTLLDTLRDLNEASNYALEYYGYNKVTLLETKAFIGDGILKLIERSLKGDASRLDDVLAAFKKYYMEHFDVYTKPYEGIMELLSYCKNKGYKMAVLSNKAQGMLDLLCKKFFDGFFDIIIGDRPDIKRKPSTMGLDIICKWYKCDYSNLTYIGDSDVDYKTVCNAGCNGIFVGYGFKGRNYLESIGAKNICDTPYDVINYLEMWLLI